MDPFASIQDHLFHQGMDLKHVQAIQTMHADRILKLEKKQADDAALKSVWTSPFPSVLTGTPQQGPMHTPATNVFDDFDDSHCQSLLNSLHLDEEPVRRGASRANSVRFDVSAIQGSSWGHASRPSSDFAPARPGSAFGAGGRSHSMERAMSHKSDGRHSSAGHSVHSAHSASGRTSSLGLNNHFTIGDPEDEAYDMPAPPPGLFVLGSVPTIIRCWLNEEFSHSSLLYAVICTGSQKSTVDHSLLRDLGLLEQVQKDSNGNSYARLPVYLPEAVVTQPSSRPCSPGPQLPTLTVNFDVLSSDLATKSANMRSIRVFLGSDTLRAHTADILLSSNVMALTGDDGNRLRVPFVRPEDDAIFKNIVTGHVVREKMSLKGTAAPFTPAAEKRSTPGSQSYENEPTTPRTTECSSRGNSPPKSVVEVTESSASESSTEPKTALKVKAQLETKELKIDTKAATNGSSSSTLSQPSSAISAPKSFSAKSPITAQSESTSASGIWSSWRSGAPPSTSTLSTFEDKDAAREGTSTSGYKPSTTRHLRSMKVLKPSTSKAFSTAGRSVSGGAGLGTGSAGPGERQNQGRVGTGASYEPAPPPHSPLDDPLSSSFSPRRKSGGADAGLRWETLRKGAGEKEEGSLAGAVAGEGKKMKLISGAKTANPIGTASAFSWMKPVAKPNVNPSVNPNAGSNTSATE